MPNRRVFLTALPLAFGGFSITARCEDLDVICLRAAGELQKAMHDRHGGEWQFAINHEIRAVVVFEKSAGL